MTTTALLPLLLAAIYSVQRRGRARLHLDAAPARLGSWLSGLVEVPERLHGSDIRLYVECVRTSYRPGWFEQKYRWHSIALLDGSPLAASTRRTGRGG